MNKKVLTLLASVALLLVIGTFSTAIVVAGTGSTIKGTVTVLPDSDGARVKGGNATLKMNDAGDFSKGFSSRVNTKDLVPGNVYSLWWELFDTGEFGSGPGLIARTVIWADGGIAGNNGELSLEATFPADTAAAQLFPARQAATVIIREITGLKVDATNTVDAVGHVIVNHGSQQLGLVGAQIGTRPGGCLAANSGPDQPVNIPALEGTTACGGVQRVSYP